MANEVMNNKTLYICRYAGDINGVKPEKRPNCNGVRCSDECAYTSDPGKARYSDHRVFQIDRNGNKWEVMRG